MSSNLDALLREVRERLTAEADPKRATFGEGYHATAMRIRGVRTPVLRGIAGDLARQLREEPATAVELDLRLVESGGYEERTLAYTLLSRHRAAPHSSRRPRSTRSAQAARATRLEPSRCASGSRPTVPTWW